MIKKFISLLIVTVMVISCSCFAFAAQAQPDGFGRYDHVFIIGVDGAGAAFREIDSPCFDRIFADGAVRHDARSESITISAQNWGSILTGVSCEEHGLTNKICETTERSSDTEFKSIFYYAREKFPDAELVSFNNWTAINKGIVENDINVTKIHASSDKLVTDSIVDYISEGNKPKLLFVQLDDVDHTAHSYGGFSEKYYAALETADTYIGRIYDSASEAGLMENGLFIVVADHGETHNGHGGNTPEESSVVVAVQGKAVNSMTLGEGVRNRDVAAIALHALGIEKPSHMTATLPDNLFIKESEPEPEQKPEAEEKPCEYCKIIHEDFFDEIICFFKRIALFFNELFK